MRKFPALATLNRSASVVALAAGLAGLAGAAHAVPTVFFNEDLVAGEATFVNAIIAADAAYNLANNDTQTSNIFTYDIMNNTGASFTVTSGAETVYVRTSQSQNAGLMNSVDGDEQNDGFTGWGNSHDGTWAGAVALGYTVEFFADAGYTTPYLMNAVGLYVTNWGTCCTTNNPTPDGSTVNASEVYMQFNGGTPLLVGGISTSIPGEEHFVAAIDDRNSFSSVTLIANGLGEYFGAGAYLTFSTVQLNSVPAGLSVVTVGDTTPDIDTDQEAYTTDELANSEVNPTFAGGTLLVTSSQEIGNGFTVGGAGGTVDTDGFDLTLTGVIDGGGQFTKTGAGTLVLTGANTYSGGTRIEEGDIEIDDASSLGSGDITFAGGTLTLGQGAGDGVTLNQGLVVEATNGTLDTSGGDLTIGGGLGGPGTLAITGGNGVTLASAATAGIDLTGGTLTIATEAGGSASGPIGLGGGGTLTTDGDYTFTGALNVTGGTLDTSGGDLTIGGGLGGPGTLAITGGNGVTLASAATAGIDLTGGTLTIATEAGGSASGPIGLGGGGTLTTDGDYTFTGALNVTGGTLDTSGGDLTIGGGLGGPGTLAITGGNGVTLASAATAGIDLTGGTLTIATEAGGSASGPIGLGGGGTLTTDGDYTFTGALNVTGGTLDTSGGDLTIGGGLGGPGTLAITGGNGVTLASAATAGIDLTGGTLTIATEAGGSASGPIGLGGGGTLTTDGDYTFTGALNVTGGTLDTSGGNLTIGGGLGGPGTLAITGGNDVTLASAATAGIDLTGGTLTIATGTGGSASGPIGLGEGSTLTTDGDYTFTGSLTFNGGVIDTGASTITLAGGATGPSCLIKQGSGRMVLAADASNDIGACVEEGTLSQNAVFTGNVWVYEPGTLRGTGLIGGNVEVAGRVAPGNSPGTLTVDGDVTMLDSGTLQIDIDGRGTGTGAGNYSRVLASGTFTADGSIEPLLRGITGDANNDFTPEVGDTFIVVAADDGIEGSFDTLVQPDEGLADGTRFDIFYNANTIVLAITPDSFANVDGLKGNAGTVATTIDGLRDDDAGTSLRFNLAGLDTGGLRTSMQQLGGEIHADLLAAGLEGRRLARGAVGQHLANLRSGRKSVTPIADATREATGSRKAGDAAAMVENVEPGEVLWVQGIGRTGHVSGDAMAFGYKYDVAGVAAGLDVAVGGGWRLGAGLAAISGDVDSRSMDLGHGNAKSTQLFAYASWAQSGYFVDAVVAYGSDRYTTSRSVVLADGAVANDSSAKGHSWAADLSAGARLSLGSVTVEPTVGLRWDRGNRKALTEGGSAVTGLTFDKETLTALQGKAGVRAQHVYALKSVAITAEARAFWLHDFNKANDTLTPVLAGASFGVASANPGGDAASLGAGLSIDTTENVDLYVDYDAQLRKGETAHAVIGGLRVRF